MTYSYTQISQYLTCPRRYRHRYLDGWKEKRYPAPRCFSVEPSNRPWLRSSVAKIQQRRFFGNGLPVRRTSLQYSHGDSWDRMLQQGIQLLERFAQDDRIRIRQPQRDQQVKLIKKLSDTNDFVAYVDAIGQLDGTRCLSGVEDHFQSVP